MAEDRPPPFSKPALPARVHDRPQALGVIREDPVRVRIRTSEPERVGPIPFGASSWRSAHLIAHARGEGPASRSGECRGAPGSFDPVAAQDYFGHMRCTAAVAELKAQLTVFSAV